MSIWQQMWALITAPGGVYLSYASDSIKLSLTAMVLAVVIATPLGALVARQPIVAFITANLSGILRAIPTLAFLAVAIDYLGTGFKPSLVALVILGIPPILLNTIAGLQGIDPTLLDAAKGLGMTRWQTLLRVEAPLTLPSVAAGIRTAAVQIVATAALAALIGGGGWGVYINDGFYHLNDAELFVGAGSFILLAFVTEFALAGVQRLVTPRGVLIAQASPDEALEATANATPPAQPTAAAA
ncbi:MAG TPA: ABC transporter permease [Ktedonobacterales bacterium]|nr:ABC transporter permease [Ktedonobacterales bacterium]